MVESTKDRISEYNCVFSVPPKLVPTNKVVDAPITGNGDIGILLSGNPENLKFIYQKTISGK